MANFLCGAWADILHFHANGYIITAIHLIRLTHWKFVAWLKWPCSTFTLAVWLYQADLVRGCNILSATGRGWWQCIWQNVFSQLIACMCHAMLCNVFVCVHLCARFSPPCSWLLTVAVPVLTIHSSHVLVDPHFKVWRSLLSCFKCCLMLLFSSAPVMPIYSPVLNSNI